MIEIRVEGDIEDYFCAAYLITDKAYIYFDKDVVKLEAKCNDDVETLFLSELKEYREYKALLNKTSDDRNLMYKKALLSVNTTPKEVEDIAKPWSENE